MKRPTNRQTRGDSVSPLLSGAPRLVLHQNSKGWSTERLAAPLAHRSHRAPLKRRDSVLSLSSRSDDSEIELELEETVDPRGAVAAVAAGFGPASGSPRPTLKHAWTNLKGERDDFGWQPKASAAAAAWSSEGQLASSPWDGSPTQYLYPAVDRLTHRPNAVHQQPETWLASTHGLESSRLPCVMSRLSTNHSAAASHHSSRTPPPDVRVVFRARLTKLSPAAG
jgi:hypothetical protein